MYCTQCGQPEPEGCAYCPHCGKRTPGAPQPSSPLVRIREGKKIAGVCSGFARYIGVDVTLVRIGWLLIALTCGVGFIAYIVAWIAMPLEETAVYRPASA